MFVEGGLYHVYNRLGRGERFFREAAEAQGFVSLLREVVERDGLTVYAWCLMGNHYHMAVRMGQVPLDRPMRSLQQRVTHRINVRHRVYGPLWQGRYRAKGVLEQRYLDQLLVYIHLNPVQAGLVGDPAEYEWSGDPGLLGRAKNPIVDVDEVLRVFGTTRRAARAAYVRRLKGAIEEPWIGEAPGRLPWWRLGRPRKGEDEDPEAAVRERRAREEMGPEWRPTVAAGDFIVYGAELLDVSLDDLRARDRSRDVVEARELLLVLGVERYALKVNALARELHKTPDGMSQALARAVRRRAEDVGFLRRVNELDRRMSDRSGEPISNIQQ